MTIDEMFDELENKVRDTYIVTLKYKYDFEENYTIENHILEYESITDSYVWLNDWYEGQTDIEVLGYMLLGDVDTTKLLTCEDCISREEAIRIAEQGQIQGFEWQIKKLCTLSSVIPQPKMGEWILCDNQLPPKDKNVLVTRMYKGKPYVEIAEWNDGWTSYSDEYKVDYFIEHQVVAWQPLPQPYKAESGVQDDE